MLLPVPAIAEAALRADASAWRDAFVALAEDLARDRGDPPPDIGHDPQDALELTFAIDGVAFAFVHDPSHGAQELLVQCRLGPRAEACGASGLEALLIANRGLWDRGVTLGADPEDGGLVFAARVALQGLDAAVVQVLALDLAELARVWTQELAGTTQALSTPEIRLPCRTADDDDEDGDVPHAPPSAAVVAELAARVRRRLGGAFAEDEARARFTWGQERFALAAPVRGRRAALTIDCDFGPLPPDHADSLDAGRHLLEVNLVLAQLAAPMAFAVDPVTRHVVCVDCRDGAPPAIEPLAGSVRRMARAAQAWRTNRHRIA